MLTISVSMQFFKSFRIYKIWAVRIPNTLCATVRAHSDYNKDFGNCFCNPARTFQSCHRNPPQSLVCGHLMAILKYNIMPWYALYFSIENSTELSLSLQIVSAWEWKKTKSYISDEKGNISRSGSGMQSMLKIFPLLWMEDYCVNKLLMIVWLSRA